MLKQFQQVTYHPFLSSSNTIIVKRVFLVLAGTVVYIILAIVGASHFESWLDTLLVILSVGLGSSLKVLCSP